MAHRTDRHRFTRIITMLVLLATVVLAAGSPGRGLGAGRDTGDVTLGTGPGTYCNTFINAANAGTEAVQVLVLPPAVFASPNWHTANPLLAQPVRFSTILGHIKQDGSFEALQQSQPKLDTAGFGSSPADFGGSGIVTQSTIGPNYQMRLLIEWRNKTDTQTLGQATVIQPLRWKMNNAAIDSASHQTCPPPVNIQFNNLSDSSATVNTTFQADIRYGDPFYGTDVRWDGQPLAFEYLGSFGGSMHRIKPRVPAAPKGSHTVSVERVDGSTASFTFTVKPRIKVIPGLAERGDTVDVSLRGFAAFEVVQIRWKKSNSWIVVATVTTSKTGSANVDVTVPPFAKDGLQKVRGDGATSAAQTNAFEVQGGPGPAAVQAASPTATPTPTSTATPTLTATPETTPVASPIATVEPTATPVATDDSAATQEPVSTEEPLETPVTTDEATTEPVTPEAPALDPTPEPDPTELPVE